MTADERALVQAVIAAPDDDAPRLVYADWLDEHGRPTPAAVLRAGHHRAGGDPAGCLHLVEKYPDLWLRTVYLAGAAPDLVAAVPEGVVFLMAWWSGRARQAFTALAAALRTSDPAGELVAVVVDIDGVAAGFDRLVRPHRVHLSGAGEALWVCRGQVVGATAGWTPVGELEWRARGLLSPRCSADRLPPA